jgi:hypothetical protein
MMLDLPQAWETRQGVRVQREGSTSANWSEMWFGTLLAGSLQGVEDPAFGVREIQPCRSPCV